MTRLSDIGLLIENIQKTLRRILKYEMKEKNLVELNPSHGKALFTLSKNDMISIQELRKNIALGSSTLTGILDHLEKLKLIERIHSKKDRREILIKLNEKNHNQFQKYRQIIKQVNLIMYNSIDNKDIKNYENISEQIFANLAEYEKNMK